MSEYYEFNNTAFVNSMEAILGNTIGLGNSQIMSFYNMHIMENPWTPSIELHSGMYLDRCLIAFNGISSITWEYDLRNKTDSNIENCFGGELYNNLFIHKEFWITYSDAQVLIPKNFKSSKQPFNFRPDDIDSLNFLTLSDSSSFSEYLINKK